MDDKLYATYIFSLIFLLDVQ